MLRISLQRFAQFATGRIRRGGHDKTMIIGAPDLKFAVNARLAGDTSKELDKNVVVRVILHAQCSLQRKEAK
jgi:hypothetical protein